MEGHGGQASDNSNIHPRNIGYKIEFVEMIFKLGEEEELGRVLEIGLYDNSRSQSVPSVDTSFQTNIIKAIAELQ